MQRRSSNYKADRPDRLSPDSKTLAVLDYKTGDSGSKPRRPIATGDWIDLQPPLYRHLVQAAAHVDLAKCRVELGYILLPKDVQEIGLALAEWTRRAGRSDEVARHVSDRFAREFSSR
jgi:hypothetical protein